MKTKDCTCGREGSDKKHTSGIHRGLALSHRTKAVYQTDTTQQFPLGVFPRDQAMYYKKDQRLGIRLLECVCLAGKKSWVPS